MGVPGLLKEIGKGDRVALAKIAIEHFEKYRKPLRIAIDAAIWNFQIQSGQGGKNPALRTLFFRLLKLLALPIHPVFVYDGKNKPLTKRGKTVSRYGSCMPNEMSKNLVARFQFPHHTAPGEAEAECAFLQQNGVVDAVMSQDVDAIVFGSTLTLRDWSKEGTKGNKTPTHVNVFESVRIKEETGLDSSGMTLVALLSGGDYHEGIPGFGPALSCQIAKAGFGEDLIRIMRDDDEHSLKDWRDRLQYELETNESGYFSKRHKTVKIPDSFPDRVILGFYLTPAVSDKEELKKLEARWLQWWDREIDIPALREYTAMTFDWLYKGGARKYIRCLAQPLFQHRLKRKQIHGKEFSMKDITEKRKHFLTDGMPELRFSAIPASVVGIDLEAEEDNPEFADLDLDEDVELAEIDNAVKETSANSVDEPCSPSKRRKRPQWDPYKPEKWWIPEALLDCGMPDVVKLWHREQFNIRADPLKFATRKCKPATKARAGKEIDQSMKHGAIEEFWPSSKMGSTFQPPQAKKPLARAKTDTALSQSSQQRDIDKFFKPSKPSRTPFFPTMGSQIDKPTNRGNLSDPGSDDEFNDDLLDLLHKSSKPIPLWLGQSKDNQNLLDAASSPTVTRRKKRPQEKLAVTDDDIVLVGAKPVPVPVPVLVPVATILTHDANLNISQTLTGRFPATVNSSTCHKRRSSDERNASAAPANNDTFMPSLPEKVDRMTSFQDIMNIGKSPAPTDRIVLAALFQADSVKSRSNDAVRKTAILRESLPGTWKEVPLTPSQNTGVAFVDLTNT